MLLTLSDDASKWTTTQLCTAYYNGLSQELRDKMDSKDFDMPNLSQLTTKQAQHDALRLVRASTSASFKVLHEEEQMMKRLLQRPNGSNPQRGRVHFTNTTEDIWGHGEHEHYQPPQNAPPPPRCT